MSNNPLYEEDPSTDAYLCTVRESSPDPTVHIALRLKRLCDQNHLSIYRLSKLCGVSYSVLHRIWLHDACPSIDTLAKICRGLNITLGQFFSEIDIPVLETTDETKKLVKLYLLLPANKRKLLFAYLYGLCDGEYISL